MGARRLVTTGYERPPSGTPVDDMNIVSRVRGVRRDGKYELKQFLSSGVLLMIVLCQSCSASTYWQLP